MGGGGARLAVAAASGVLAACVAGAPLYVSSVGSESVQDQLSQMCLTDAGLTMYLGEAGSYTFGGKPIERVEAGLADIVARLDHAQAPVVTTLTAKWSYATSADAASGPPLLLVHREGQDEHIPGAPPPLGEFEALVPEWTVDSFAAGGGRFFVRVPSATEVTDPATGEAARDQATWEPFQLAGSYPDVGRPEPSYWCGLRAMFRTDNLDERPPPAVFVDAATIAQVPSDRIWEVRPDPAGITFDDAVRLREGFELLSDRYLKEMGYGEDTGRIRSELPTAIARAEGQRDLVTRSLAPVELGAIITAAGLLVASGVMLARERRPELRLRVLRGAGPAALALRLAAGQLIPVVLGAGVGVTTAFVGIRTFGPTPELEDGPVRTALGSAAVGVLAAVGVVAVVAATAGVRTVDRQPLRRHRIVPWELLPLGLAIVSFVRLDDGGGVRLSGPEARGGDLLAQAFPLLAVLAPLALLARPLGALMRRSSRIGEGLPVPLLLGVRRISHASGAFTMLTLAIALGVGSYVASTSLRASAEQMLVDKAHTYVGADMVAVTDRFGELPASIAEAATQVGTVGGQLDGERALILGVDRTTFEASVRWRDDASGSSLDELLGRLPRPTSDSVSGQPADGTPTLRAIVVGRSDGGSTFEPRRGDGVAVAQVGAGRWFPGYSNGTTLVVVDLEALQRTDLRVRPAVWLREPSPDALLQLRRAGFVVGSVDIAQDVFDVTTYHAVGWAYAPLGAYAVMVGGATLMAQLLVLSAGRRSRQATWTLTSRMGMRRRDEAAAVLTELGVPLVVGGALGLLFGWLTMRVAIPRFDTLRQLEPPARTILPGNSVAPPIAVGVAMLLLLAALSLVAIARTRPMEVMRGGN